MGDAWGKITSVTLNTAKNVELAPEGHLSFNESQAFDLLTNRASIELGILKNDVGSLFIAPTDAPIKLTIKAEDGRTATVDMTATGGFKAGSQYILILYFDSLSVVDALCTLESWENQNDNLYLE